MLIFVSLCLYLYVGKEIYGQFKDTLLDVLQSSVPLWITLENTYHQFVMDLCD